MATFEPIVNPATSFTLVDGVVPSGSGDAAPRFAKEPIVWVRVDGPVDVHAFAAATVRFIAATGDPDNPTASTTLIEVSPVPSFDRAAFLALRYGLPLQYVLLDQAQTTATEDDFAAAGAGVSSIAAGAHAWFGVCWQDRLMRDPAAWANAIAAASPASSNWPPFAAALAAVTPNVVRILDHIGRPFTGTGVNVAGSVVTYSTAQHPILAGGETEGGSFNGPYTLAPGERHVQVLDAGDWFGTPPPAGLQRWTTGNLIEPILDGNPYFARLIQDLPAAANGGGAYFAGWDFRYESLLDTTQPWPLVPGDSATEFVKRLIKLRDVEGAGVRLLVNNYLQANVSTLDDLKIDALLAILGVAVGPTLFPEFFLAVVGLNILETHASLLELLEKSTTVVNDLNAGVPGTALWSSYPADISDNPLLPNGLVLPAPDPGDPQIVVDDITRFGAYHQKLVLIRPSPPATDFVGYLGGIDVDSNRVDTPLHRALSPFHDVQIRVTGPAVSDLATTYAQRLALDAPAASFPLPAAQTQPGGNVVQIARTYFVPKPASPTPAFPFAPDGEKLIYDTLLKAVRAARDFIYIEDQYFTPGDELVQALLDASNHAAALIVTVPALSDQPFGELRRTDVVKSLTDAWGGRFRIGAPMRRRLVPTPTYQANFGRCRLKEKMEAADKEAILEPIPRARDGSYWMFVGNELMYCDTKKSVDEHSVTMNVIRDKQPPHQVSWGAKPGDHKKGTPVMLVRMPAVYVHAKLTIVDDVFLGVGSANMNRRSHFHDGEIDAFIVPEHLKGASDNPVRTLRGELWAHHLGLPQSMGPSLFADPHSALAYFDRSWYAGTLWQPLSFTGAPPYVTPLPVTEGVGTSLMHLYLGVYEHDALHPLWKGVVDPTTNLDPNPASDGPEYPA